MYGFLRQPKWIAAHVLVLVLLATFVGAGVWQYTRHTARQDEADAVNARRDLAPLNSSDLADVRPEEHEFRRIELTGTWIPGDAVLIRNRSHAGASGCHLAAPLDTGAPPAALVVVGWYPDGACVTGEAAKALTDETTTALGRLRETQTRGSLGPRDPAEGRLDTLARTDLARIDQQVGLALAPMYVELIEANPMVAGPLILEAPVSDAGPHFAYAVQWLLFFAVGAVGYPLVLRHQARRGDLDAAPDPSEEGGLPSED
ncbi:MAG: SURF1 family protein [Actinomycetota bacterium]|jgi:cytochrome oxidase assembly protein ShyY1|nr:SURF1 family protein [Actinomycetota bacterium]